MVGFLQFFKSDPNKKGRGSGYYYHRGKGYFSKYSEAKDAQYRAKPKRIRNKKGKVVRVYQTWWKPKRVGGGKYKHTKD